MPDEMALMLARLLSRIERDNGDNPEPKAKDGDFISILELESNYDKLTQVRSDPFSLSRIFVYDIKVTQFVCFRPNKKIWEYF